MDRSRDPQTADPTKESVYRYLSQDSLQVRNGAGIRSVLGSYFSLHS